MRIIIKEPDSKKGFRLILPYHIMVNLCVRKSWVKMGLKGKKNVERDQDPFKNDEKVMAFIDALDFGELRGAMHDLSIKSGIVLVEVAAADGTFVQIVT